MAQSKKNTKGVIAGSFDVLHPGYIHMFKIAKNNCNELVVALHDNPSLERPSKFKPVQTLKERKIILNSIKYIDKIITYKTEIDFYKILKKNKFDIRFLGTEYKNKKFTGYDLGIPIKWIARNHGNSSSLLKKKIFNSIKLA